MIPKAYGWPELLRRDGDELFDHYRHTLEKLGAEKGMLGLIFNRDFPLEIFKANKLV